MTIWVITWSDGCECSNSFIEAYDNAQEAHDRANELQLKETSDMCGYSVDEYDLNSKVDWV